MSQNPTPQDRIKRQIKELRKLAVSSARIAGTQGFSSLLAQSWEKMRKKEFTLAQPSIPDDDYSRWISRNEPTKTELEAQRRESARFCNQLLISIVMPVCNPPTNLLTDAIRSVISQSYPSWELRIADGASNLSVRNTIMALSSEDKRILPQFLDHNMGISLNSNAAIQRSRGDFIALLDHDDLLSPNALFEVAQCLNRTLDMDFIYSDRDHVTIEGKRTDPLFKPDWSPDMMLCANYVTQLSVIRTTLLRDIGGFRPETDGAQDWDLILRIAERTERFIHIPKILYHWRQSPSSVSFASIRAKPYAKTSQLLVLNQYLTRNSLGGVVSHDRFGYLRIAWEVDPSILISIVIFDERTSGTLHRCLSSILKRSEHRNFEILAVCDKNRIDLPDPRIHHIQNAGDLNFASASNLGSRQAKGEFVIFLNSRAEVLDRNWSKELIGWCSRPEIGVAAPRLLSEDGKISGGAIILGLPGPVFRGTIERFRSPLGSADWYRNCTAASGTCFATRRDVFVEVGRFNENLGVTADVDFCLRVRARGYRIVNSPIARLLVHDSRMDEKDLFQTYKQLTNEIDPYFNQNLSLEKTVPTLRADL